MTLSGEMSVQGRFDQFFRVNLFTTSPAMGVGGLMIRICGVRLLHEMTLAFRTQQRGFRQTCRLPINVFESSTTRLKLFLVDSAHIEHDLPGIAKNDARLLVSDAE